MLVENEIEVEIIKTIGNFTGVVSDNGLEYDYLPHENREARAVEKGVSELTEKGIIQEIEDTDDTASQNQPKYGLTTSGWELYDERYL
jgi:hypothetical protein